MSNKVKGFWSTISGNLVGLVVVIGAIAALYAGLKPARETTPPTPMGPLVSGVDYGHSDINPKGWHSVPSAEACSYMCYARPDCKAMTYVVSDKSCWLKYAAPTPGKEADMISAVKQGAQSNGVSQAGLAP